MIAISDLAAAGFSPLNYPGQKGDFVAKTMPISRFQNANARLVDNDFICGDMRTTIEVIPDGRVQMYVTEADYSEGPYDFYTTEAQSLLNDAVMAGLEGISQSLTNSAKACSA